MYKNKIISVFLIIFIAVCFSSCGALSPNKNADNEPKPDSPQEDKEDSTVLEDIVLVNSDNSKIYAETDVGEYEFRMWPLELIGDVSPSTIYANITYLDFATNQLVYLCNEPGCLHNNENCSSFIQYSRSGKIFTNKNKDRIYFLSGGVEDEEIASENDLACIYEMALDGSSRRILAQFDSNQFMLRDDRVFSSDNALFLCVCKTDANTKSTVKELVRVDLDTGEESVLDTLEMSEHLLHMIDNNNYIVVSRTGEIGERIIKYYRRDILSGETEVLLEPVSGDRTLMFDDWLVTLHRIDDDVEMTAYNVRTGDKKNMTFNDIPDISYNILCWYDGMFLFKYRKENMNDAGYYVNLNTGEMSDNVLCYTNSGYNRLTNIYADAGDKYVVVAGRGLKQWVVTDKEGIPHLIQDDQGNRIALILKEDFWNGVPNYEWTESKMTA